jgi:hypothetical protein
MVKELLSPDALLTRPDTARFLTDSGFPVKEKTLSTMASRGGGPPFRKFGNRVVYCWSDSLDWAKDRMSAPCRSTSEQIGKKSLASVATPTPNSCYTNTFSDQEK